MKYVYRVADKNNIERGMYTFYTAFKYMYDLKSRHPPPCMDARFKKEVEKLNIEKGPYNRYNLDGRIFGYKSLDQLRAWIYDPECRNKLEDVGCIVYEILPKCGSLILGDTQCVFHIDQIIRKVSWQEVSE